jgi:type II secretory pathway component PulF
MPVVLYLRYDLLRRMRHMTTLSTLTTLSQGITDAIFTWWNGLMVLLIIVLIIFYKAYKNRQM